MELFVQPSLHTLNLDRCGMDKNDMELIANSLHENPLG